MSATETRNALIAKIDALLKDANGRRRERTLKLDVALNLLAEVADGAPFSWTDGGTVANAYQQVAVTTLILAARVDGKVYLGIGVASAKGSPTPGRAWSALQPWRAAKDGKPDGPAGEAGAKWAAWTETAGVVRIDGPELDALIETNAGVA